MQRKLWLTSVTDMYIEVLICTFNPQKPTKRLKDLILPAGGVNIDFKGEPGH